MQKELNENYRDFMGLKNKRTIVQEENITFWELSELWLTNEKIGSIRKQSVTTIKENLSTVNSHIRYYSWNEESHACKSTQKQLPENFRYLYPFRLHGCADAQA